MPFLGIKNPRIAFEKAKLYWGLINNLLLKLKQDQYSFILESPKKVPNYIVRTRNKNGELRNGHLDFYLITEDGKGIDFDFKLDKSFYFLREHHSIDLHYCYYRLSDLKSSVIELNKSIKIVYVILSTNSTKLAILPFEQFSMIEMDFFTLRKLPFLSEEKDDIQLKEEQSRLHEERRWKEISERRKSGEIIHLCPGCDYEWNNSYCGYCGHPH